MIEKIFNTPLLGSYTILLAILVIFLLWLIMNREAVEKVNSEHKVEKKEKCNKKGPCKKKCVNYPIIYAYFTSEATKNLAHDFWGYLGMKKIQCTMFDLRNCEFDTNCEGAAFFFIDQKVDWMEKWLLKVSASNEKILNDYKFAVFSAGASEIADEVDKNLWKLGAQRLKKLNGLDEDFEFWRQIVYKIVTGKSKIGCGCDGDSSSCDSENEKKIVDVEDLLR